MSSTLRSVYFCYYFPTLAMIICFMHHSYSLRVVDENHNHYFSPQYEPNPNTIIYLNTFVGVSVLIVFEQILDGDSTLHFSLLRLQLIELIRTYNYAPDNDITPAIEFATTHLAPRAPLNAQFLEDLECTMSLLLFPPDNLEPQLAALLHPDLRRTVADNVNKAILTSQHQRRDATIRNLVRLRAWAENTARENKMALPAHMDLGLDSDNPTRPQPKDNNGDDAMITS